MPPPETSPRDARHPLRIGLLIDSFEQPNWVGAILAELRSSNFARIVLVVLNGSAGTESNGTPARAAGGLSRLAYRMYCAWDDSRFGREQDALAPASILPLLEGVETLSIGPVRRGHQDSFRADDLSAIRSRELDVVLRFGFRPLTDESRTIARHGVWSYPLDPTRPPEAAPPGFWEVMRRSPVTETTLEREGSTGETVVLYRSLSATDPFSVRRSRDHIRGKSAAFVGRALRDLGECRVAISGQAPEVQGSVPPPGPGQAILRPGNLKMLRLGLGLTGRFARDRMWRMCFTEQWALAFILGRPAAPPGAFRIIRPPRDRSWADPFPVRHGESYHIFLEEIPRDTGKGHISVMTLDGTGTWGPPVKVLERDDHLAYPFVFEWSGQFFMIPETGANRTIELFRCASFPGTWVLEKVLMRDLAASDATLHQIEGRWWMFVTLANAGARNTWEELHLFHADTPLGPWRPHARNPVKSDVRSARPAGRLFQDHLGLLRPAQDCSRRYGYAIVLHRVDRLDPERFEETEISRILPTWGRSVMATHTYNRVGDLTVVDGLLRRRRIL